MEDVLADHGWPKYQVGPRESVFAIGVVSVNYARLEFSTSAIFSTIFDTPSNLSAFAISKIKSNEVITSIMREALSEVDWPKEVVARVSEYLLAYKICADNRNLLVHSGQVIGGRQTITLYKSNGKGETILCTPLLEELRQVADDINALFDYGLALSNAINVRKGDWLSQSTFPLPDKPAMPRKLEYTSGA